MTETKSERKLDRGAAHELARVFAAMADATRVALLASLANGERHVGSLCEEHGLPQPSASYHLGLLLAAGLVEVQRSGKRRIYRLARPGALVPASTFSVGGKVWALGAWDLSGKAGA